MTTLKFRSTRQPLVIYHNHCLDGFTAAFVANEALTKIHEAPELYADDYTTGLAARPISEWPIDVEDRDIYIVDFSYPPAVLKDLCLAANEVVIIDHHESAIKKLLTAFPDLKVLPDNLTLILDQEQSGAGLTWQYFFPFERQPDLILYVEDRDLWKFHYPDTKAFCVSLGSKEKTLDNYRALLNPREVDEAIFEGQCLLKNQSQQLSSLIKLVRYIIVMDYPVPVINCPGFLASEMGQHMMKVFKPRFAVTYFDGPTHRQWSLRSNDQAYDVRVIAEALGGGGHRNAAGFTTALGYCFPPAP